MYPLFRVYGAFMDIKRYDRMPFYIAPAATEVVNYEERAINLLDWLCDAHEEARNKEDRNRSFYARSIYVYNNFLRYQNDTMCNIMFDTQAKRPSYDRLNSIISQQNLMFYLAAGALHTIGFMGMSFFFRYRRVTMAPTLVLATAYYCFFESSNNILYKLLVDRHVMSEARSLGLGAHVQPCGQRKHRGFNYA